jgi:hypothetical protein
MDSFLRLHALYLLESRWKVVVHIYKQSPLPMQVIMWGAKLVFITLYVLSLLSTSWRNYYILTVLVGIIWMFTFCKARAIVFAELRRVYPKRIKYFGKDYQYIRYLAFKEQLESKGFAKSIDDALSFIDGHSEMGTNHGITSHPFMLITSGAFLSILGGAAGKWDEKYLLATLLGLAILFYFSYIVIDLSRTPTSNLMEFKRFLHWAKHDY